MVLCHCTHQAEFHVRIAELEAEVERLTGLLVSSFIIDGVSPRDARKIVEILNKDGSP